ncbi:hypothetical protein KIN20_008741 [Parelaphostrongylus tenuis]|uniref:Uncharacterized protein n=1 Tax=Parelaphostrongylus tenuis TaxID=148309 RepID=A0AAD5MA57_PARTN|nr:hypothetical protein KIN20_008741 [Parelaphostrongylus tenuis]
MIGTKQLHNDNNYIDIVIISINNNEGIINNDNGAKHRPPQQQQQQQRQEGEALTVQAEPLARRIEEPCQECITISCDQAVHCV